LFALILISREEQAKTDLLKVRLSAARRIDELKLELLDNERLLAESKSSVRLAELDATIPEATIPKLDYERYKLTLEIARKNFVLAQAELLNKRAELDDVIRESELEVRQAESNYQRIRDALKATEIHAEKAGFIVYGENRFTGRKVFPGETLYGGFKIASVASRQDLQIRFWIHEADILKVQDGQYISILADAQGATPFGASVTWTSSQAVQKQDWSESGYFEALARPTEGVPDSVMPGMSVMGEVMPKVND
jgi:multidrug resistance efflux pump